MPEAAAFKVVGHLNSAQADPDDETMFQQLGGGALIDRRTGHAAADPALMQMATSINALADRQGSLVLHVCGISTESASSIVEGLGESIARLHWSRVLCLSMLPGGRDPAGARGAIEPSLPSDPIMTRISIRDGGSSYLASLERELGEVPSPHHVRDLYATLRTSFPLILVDAPPILADPVVTSLATLADAAVLAVEAGVSRLSAIRRSRALLADQGIPVLGIVYTQRRPLLPGVVERLFD